MKTRNEFCAFYQEFLNKVRLEIAKKVETVDAYQGDLDCLEETLSYLSYELFEED